MTTRNKILSALLLFVGLVCITYLAGALPFRIDLTQGKIYTLSSGTRNILKKIEDPIEISFYFSRSANGLPVAFKNYAQRVEEMLRQYRRASGGKLKLTVIDPKPDTPEEERATAAGLTSEPLSSGERVYLGIVGVQADQQKTISFLDPNREQLLEYDLSQLINSVEQFDRKKLGLLTSLPLQGAGFTMPGQPPQQGQFVVSEWEKTSEIVSIQPDATDLPANLDVLAVIHPQNVGPKLEYAIDQFLLSGKPVFLALDPSSSYFKQQGRQQMMYGGPAPGVSSNLPTLLSGWGLVFDPSSVVADPSLATSVNAGRGVVARLPDWLSLTQRNLNSTAAATGQLSSLLFVDPGSIALKEKTDLTFTPLVQTTDKAGAIPAMSLMMMGDPDELYRQITGTSKRTLAALVQGKFKSAFPNGVPKDEPKPADNKDANKPDAPPQKPEAPSLKESRTTSTLIMVGDSDWLLDDYSVRRLNFLVTNAAEPLNDNLAFGSNALDFLAASQDLLSIRGKGSSQRPFIVVRQIESAAQEKYQKQLDALESRLSGVTKKLNDL